MVADDGQPTAGSEQPERSRENRFQLIEFTIDGDTKRLEDTRQRFGLVGRTDD